MEFIGDVRDAERGEAALRAAWEAVKDVVPSGLNIISIEELPFRRRTRNTPELKKMIASWYLKENRAIELHIFNLEDAPLLTGWNFEYVREGANAHRIQILLRFTEDDWIDPLYHQLFLLHELAHCFHRAHDDAFWTNYDTMVRNKFPTGIKTHKVKGYNV